MNALQFARVSVVMERRCLQFSLNSGHSTIHLQRLLGAQVECRWRQLGGGQPHSQHRRSISSMVTKIGHHAAVVGIMVARW
jgi:hypothetical protein